MGLLDGLFGGGGDVKANLIGVDPEVSKAIKANRDAAINTSQDEYANQAMSGVSQAPQDHADQVNQSERALGGDEPGMSGAINQRYQGIVGEKLGNMANQAKMKGFETKAGRLQTVTKFDQAQQNIIAENKQRQLAADNANASARGSMLSSVLGIGAMVAASALTGGAAAPLAVKGGMAVAGGKLGNKAEA